MVVRKRDVQKARTTSRQELGSTGERLAVAQLIQSGYRILEQNFRCRCGEMDIVAEEQDDLVFVEVKTRRGVSCGLPEEAITPQKRRKLVKIAHYYLYLHSCPERSWRIDVVAVQFSTQGKLEEIRIYQHAISEEQSHYPNS